MYVITLLTGRRMFQLSHEKETHGKGELHTSASMSTRTTGKEEMRRNNGPPMSPRWNQQLSHLVRTRSALNLKVREESRPLRQRPKPTWANIYPSTLWINGRGNINLGFLVISSITRKPLLNLQGRIHHHPPPKTVTSVLVSVSSH